MSTKFLVDTCTLFPTKSALAGDAGANTAPSSKRKWWLPAARLVGSTSRARCPFCTSIDEPYPKGIEGQTHQVVHNLRTVLVELGLDLVHVVQVRVYPRKFDRDYESMTSPKEEGLRGPSSASADWQRGRS